VVVTSESIPTASTDFWRFQNIGDMPSYHLAKSLIGSSAVTTAQNELITCQADFSGPAGYHKIFFS
jgi:hypothetical protein